MSNRLEIRNLTKQFGDGPNRVTAVDDVSLTIDDGELFSLLGESGCGKTTTLRILAGLETVTSGHILYGGRDFTRTPANQRGIGMVFQSYALYPHMTIFENVGYGLRVRRTPKAQVREKVEATMEQVGLPPAKYGNRKPSELSGGQQQRVAVARSLVYDPAVLLFDEPLSNLDAKLRVYMREELRDIQRNAGITAVYVTHDQEEALAISDRIAVMSGGRVHQVGTPLEVYETPKDRYVADFIGKANLLPGRVVSEKDGFIRVKLSSGDIVQARASGESDYRNSGDIRVVTRPERLGIFPRSGGKQGTADGTSAGAASSNDRTENTIRAKVTKLVYLGNRTRYELVTMSDTPFTVDSVRLVEGIDTGSEVLVRVEPREALVLPAQSMGQGVGE